MEEEIKKNITIYFPLTMKQKLFFFWVVMGLGVGCYLHAISEQIQVMSRKRDTKTMDRYRQNMLTKRTGMFVFLAKRSNVDVHSFTCYAIKIASAHKQFYIIIYSFARKILMLFSVVVKSCSNCKRYLLKLFHITKHPMGGSYGKQL